MVHLRLAYLVPESNPLHITPQFWYATPKIGIKIVTMHYCYYLFNFSVSSRFECFRFWFVTALLDTHFRPRLVASPTGMPQACEALN
jgi:hypothetical protein